MSGREVAMVLLSALLHAAWNAATKGSRSPLAFLMLLELFGSIALAPVLLACDLGALPRAAWGWLACTALAHGFYSFWLATSYARGDLAVVYPISRSAPALVPLIAVPLLGETLSVWGALGIGCVLAGIWAVQTDGHLRWRALLAPGTGYAYLTLGATVVFAIVDKRLVEVLEGSGWSGPLPAAVGTYALITLSHFPVFALLAGRKLRASELATLTRTRAPALAGGVLATFASYALILETLRTAPVSYVVAARQTSVVFAVAIAALWLRERPGRVRLLGALATVAGVALIALAG